MCLAIPGKIEKIIDNNENPFDKMGKVNFSGIVKDVCLAYVPEAEIGQYVIVHVGFAIGIVQEEEAKKVLEYLAKMGELAEIEESQPRESGL